MDNDELNQEIHKLISLLVKQHVRSWYTELSQDEQLFNLLKELTNEIHAKLAGRAQVVDWEAFAVESLPELVLLHLQDFNRATERCRTNQNFATSFIDQHSHIGVIDEQAYLTHVSDGLLTILLPYDDLINDVAYSFTRELLADLLLRDVVDRLSEPWFWDEMILKFIEQRNKKSHGSWSEVLLSISDRIMAFVRTTTWTARRSLYDTAIPSIIEELLRPSELPLGKMLLSDVVLPIADLLVGDTILQRMRKGLRRSLNNASLTKVVRLTHHILFPDGQPSPTRVIPSLTEQEDNRARVAQALPIAFPFLAHKSVNKVLIFKLLDALLGTIFPELKTRSPQQLKDKVIAIVNADREAGGEGGIGSFTRS